MGGVVPWKLQWMVGWLSTISVHGALPATPAMPATSSQDPCSESADTAEGGLENSLLANVREKKKKTTKLIVRGYCILLCKIWMTIMVAIYTHTNTPHSCPLCYAEGPSPRLCQTNRWEQIQLCCYLFLWLWIRTVWWQCTLLPVDWNLDWKATWLLW